MTKRSSSSVPGVPSRGARLSSLADSWERSLKARNLADTALHNYLYAVHRVIAYWETQADGPRYAREVTREHCEQFQAYELAPKPEGRGLMASSVATFHQHIRLFFAWCADEEEIGASPMAHVKRPIVPDQDAPPPVLEPAEVTRLLKACIGKDFNSRRDAAMLLLLFDCGVRHNEVMGMTCDDVDLDNQQVTVHRKFRRMEVLPLSNSTVSALDRYLRIRATHRAAASPALWLGRQGALKYDTLARIVDLRAAQAGLGHIWPHVARHTWASHLMERGMQEGDLMQLAGWRSRTMLGRYGRKMAQRRAKEAHKRLAPGDQY